MLCCLLPTLNALLPNTLTLTLAAFLTKKDTLV